MSSTSAHQAREKFGARLREIRKGAGLTGQALARHTGWHLSKISRIEHGKQNITEDDVRIWCQYCDAQEQMPDLIATVRHLDAMWMEWRRSLQTGTHRRQYRSIALYDSTTHFRVWEPFLIWGTLQTAEYAGVVLSNAVRFYELPDDVDEGVAARMERQQYLYRGHRRFSALISERALYTNIGGSDVMVGQLDRLLAVMSLPRLSLGIVPAAAPHRLTVEHGFVMFDDRMVMAETLSAEMTITQPREIALYARAHAIYAEMAVYGGAAKQLISQALADWTSRKH
ncbi:helix-turn-helix domain-containing protein [Allonocardiopsis opalescens]|uniref:Helix-turn-helix protein n=1 Tax=Allonocardiopsis opalescens TaxID=1144618 RepID=A0A2T0PZ15_9ACTN|nr:helix-turn-helix transcriptional regulator [Allonocardiopsis opalescens]PRX96679.1 helix-turn-helix protein [Allonocardiopsis opalescens]